eukprot:Polyplicarium_translucidae@DN3218_c0_g1_i1.p1
MRVSAWFGPEKYLYVAPADGHARGQRGDDWRGVVDNASAAAVEVVGVNSRVERMVSATVTVTLTNFMGSVQWIGLAGSVLSMTLSCTKGLGHDAAEAVSASVEGLPHEFMTSDDKTLFRERLMACAGNPRHVSSLLKQTAGVCEAHWRRAKFRGRQPAAL